MNKDYTGSCYIGVVGSELEIGQCHDSIAGIIRQPSDIGPVPIRATKGYEARQMHFNNWLNKTECPFMLLLDSDMMFPDHTLERLRSHNQPFISGAYMRRRYAPPVPVWFQDTEPGVMPYKPDTRKLEKNRLYRIGASGWGCILIHRDVALAVRELLKGEEFVIEDDMDVYPYDLRRIMDAITRLESGHDPEAVKVLREEIRPLRRVKDLVGSDVRFPFFAKLAGYDLYLDTGVICGHMTNYPVSFDDYVQTPNETIQQVEREIEEIYQKELVKLEGAK